MAGDCGSFSHDSYHQDRGRHQGLAIVDATMVVARGFLGSLCEFRAKQATDGPCVHHNPWLLVCLTILIRIDG